MFEKLALKAGGVLIAGAATFALGVAFTEAFERGSPWGLQAAKDRLEASIPGKLAKARQEGAAAQAEADRPAFEKWSADLKACRTARETDATEASRDLAKASTFASTQASAAYRLGRSTCGAKTNANPTPGGPGAVAGGVREQPDDFRTLFGSGAYTPAGADPMSGRR